MSREPAIEVRGRQAPGPDVRSGATAVTGPTITPPPTGDARVPGDEPGNVADLLSRAARATPDAPALIGERGTTRYRALDALVWGLCRSWHERGLQAGHVIGLHLQDTALHLVALLAAARLGMTSVAVESGATDASAARRVLARTGARAVVDDRAVDWGSMSRIDLDVEGVEHAAGPADDALRCARPEAWLIYKTSSGTTGNPKIVPASHHGMWVSIERERAAIGYPVGERYLTPVSFAHDGPRRRILACLASGGTVVLPPSQLTAATLIATIERHDVRHFSSVPMQALALAQAVPPGAPRFERMRCLRLSAGPSEAQLHRLLRERLSPQVWVSYGCTELGPMTVASPEVLARWPQSVGLPMPGVEVEIVDADGRGLPPGTVGQVRVRAQGMPQAYHDDPRSTAQNFRNGWFHPGDLGRQGEQGALFHLGRADDLMILNGINIYPAEIEQAMLAHPAVRDAAALPLKLPVVNDVPVCAVALHEGLHTTPPQLLGFARRSLGARAPKKLVVLDAIPRNAQGKVQRGPLREQVRARLEAASAPGRADLPSPASPERSSPAAAPSLPDAPEPESASPAVIGQLAVRIQMKFHLAARADLGRLDAWLAALPETAGLAALLPDGATIADDERLAVGQLQRTLQLAVALLQAAQVPVFDAPRIVGCRRADAEGEPGRVWLAGIELPRVDELPPAAYQVALAEANHLRDWVLARPLTDAHRQAFFGLVERRVLERLKPLWRVGKSTLPLLRAVHRASIPFIHLGGGVFQLGWGRRAERIYRSVAGSDRATAARLSTNKAWSAALLRKAGLPAPVHQVVATWPEALSAARVLGWPLVVKPADRERGEGVQVDVTDEARLRSGFDAALGLSPSRSVIVERQVDGTCHRLFVARGRLLYAVKRLPMSIEGDGTRCVAALVDAEVARQRELPPWRRSGIVPLDDEARAELARAGRTEDWVPGAGEWVALRRIETTAWSGVDEDVTHRVHPENLRVALTAAELFGLEVGGIDLITADIARPWFETGAIVNEVNYAPLLGGGAISRSRIPAFLAELLGGSGTLPVEVYVGGDAAWAAAEARWRALREDGLAACLSDERRTLAASGVDWPMPLQGLYGRVRALVLSPRVEALVLVLRTDELLATGWPLEAVSAVTVVDRQLVRRGGGEPLSPDRAAQVCAGIERWPRLGAVGASPRKPASPAPATGGAAGPEP